jgi:hypothetical protein
MTLERKQLRSPEGPVAYDVVVCDARGCQLVQTTTALIGWVHLEKLGVSIKTLGGDKHPLPADFCSLDHLQTWISGETVKPPA